MVLLRAVPLNFVDRNKFILYDTYVKTSVTSLGMVQVYTGMGKGKTTAALGLAFRALGQGKKVLLVQFMKQGRQLGEVKAAGKFKQFKILQSGSRGWVKKGSLALKDKQLAQKGLSQAQKAINSRKYDLVILDELNVVLEFGLVRLKEVKQLLALRPAGVELVITGRHAHPEILASADLVSEIREVKHYYQKGITQRAGIEY